MKKTFLLSCFLLSLIMISKPQKAEAQITGATITGYDIFISSQCILPNKDSININGSLTGSVPAHDTVTIYVNFDDGSDTTFRLADYSYGGSAGGSFYAAFTHLYTTPGTYTVFFKVTTSSLIRDSSTDAPFSLADTCSTISGILYVDANGNCIHDPGEVYLSWVPVLLVNTSTSDTTWGAWTNDSGYYSMEVFPGTYTVIGDPALYSWWWYWWGTSDSNLHPTCPSSGTASVTAISAGSYTKSFAYACTPPDTIDVGAEGWSYCYVPGDTTIVELFAGNWWWYWDYNCTSLSSTITLTLDSRLTYAGTPSWGVPPTTVSGSTLTWNYSTGTTDYFGFWSAIRVAVSTSAVLGDTIHNTLYASPTSITDPNLANNTDVFSGIVTSSFDPNGKEVSPQGTGNPGYIDNNTPLSYEIHFQNTGTAAARNVTVVDTLSPNVDPKTIHILKSTFPCTIYTSGNLVKFCFNGINLPDSTSNPLGSIGSIIYGVMPKPGLAPLTQITNKAAIFFDYNPAVWTGSTLNTIRGTTGVAKLINSNFKASVYPNPADNLVYAESMDKTDFNMTITDMLGRNLASGKSINGKLSISTQTLTTGIYIVKLVNTSGAEITDRLLIEH